MRNRLSYIAQLVAVLGGVLSMKFYYSAASVNQLRWILAPTTMLVELVTGRHFTFESHAGYMSSDHTFLIAASCAGVNFLITAFLMLSFRDWWRNRPNHRGAAGWKEWLFLPRAAAVAYVTTLVANTARISIALQMQQMSFKVRWLDGEQLHRLEGIFVYFAFLLLLFVLSERSASAREASTSPKSLLRPCAFPLLIYYTMTLGLPLANGGFRHAGFWEHSLFVLVAPVAIVLLIGLALLTPRLLHKGRVQRAKQQHSSFIGIAQAQITAVRKGGLPPLKLPFTQR